MSGVMKMSVALADLDCFIDLLLCPRFVTICGEKQRLRRRQYPAFVFKLRLGALDSNPRFIFSSRIKKCARDVVFDKTSYHPRHIRLHDDGGLIIATVKKRHPTYVKPDSLGARSDFVRSFEF